MARKSGDCIIGDAQQGDPVREIVNQSDFLRRCGYSPTQGWMMISSKETVEESGKKRARKPQLPEELSRVNLNTAGIDVGASSHFVAVPADRSEPQVREFASYTADLYRLADWLTDCEIEAVVMESTGVYWIPLFGVLEDRGFAVMLVDPRRIKNVPGRKTGVLDCQWLQQLHTYGLLSAAFRPEGEVRRLRSYLRQRSMLVRYASQHIQHMQKALSQMNVKLQHVIRDVTGKTGMAIIEDIVGGEQDAHKLAQHRDPRIRADQETIARSLQGHWREEHIFELAQALELYRVYQGKIAECDGKIEAALEQFEHVVEGAAPAKAGRIQKQKNAPAFDVRSHLYRMTGVDLTRIDGSRRLTLRIEGDQRDWHGHDQMGHCQALRVLAGAEPRQPYHRWQGHELKDQTQRQPGRGGIAPGCPRAAPLRQRFGGLPAPEESALGGAPAAINATAHKLARLIYSMLRYGQDYVDAGAEYYESQYQQRALRAAKQRASQLGYQLVPMSDAPGAPPNTETVP